MWFIRKAGPPICNSSSETRKTSTVCRGRGGNVVKHRHFRDDKCADLWGNRTRRRFHTAVYIRRGPIAVGPRGFVFSPQQVAPPATPVRPVKTVGRRTYTLNRSVHVRASRNFSRCVCSHRLRTSTASSQTLRSRRAGGAGLRVRSESWLTGGRSEGKTAWLSRALLYF